MESPVKMKFFSAKSAVGLQGEINIWLAKSNIDIVEIKNVISPHYGEQFCYLYYKELKGFVETKRI